MDLVAIVLACCLSLVSALPAGRWRVFANQMYNPDLFMDPTFSVGGQGDSQTQDASVMQAMALNIVQNQAQGSEINSRQVNVQQPPLGSQTTGQSSQNQGKEGVMQSQDKIQPGVPSQTGTLTNGQPPSGDNKFQVSYDNNDASKLPQGPNMANVNRPNSQLAAPVNTNANPASSNTNTGIQQSVGSPNMFNSGASNSFLQAPPGTGRNSMLNSFGGNGLSMDPSNFFKPKQNPDGSISGAAGNASGPPTMGPGIMQIPNSQNSNGQEGNSNSNNNYNSMFGPPSFFMNPGSSFGQK